LIEPTAESWVPVAEESNFPIQNLPYGVFSVAGGPPRVGVAISDQILDLTGLESTGALAWEIFRSGTLEPLLARGRDTWADVRGRLFELLETSSRLQNRVRPHLVSQNDAEMHLPCRIGNYVDFYSSIHHATNVGKILRPGTDPLTPNWRHMPIGYHGRARTVVVDGTVVRRPQGQRTEGDFGPTRRLDFELEVGFITGPGRSLGDPVPAIEAEDHIFGLVLVNDWSARDIQAWEYQPLGPFLGKSFATTISPWVVPLDALRSFRVEPPVQDPPPLPYLTPHGQGLDLALEVAINDSVVVRSNTKYLYWTMSQQLAHATSNGSTFGPGDLFASGTVSGPTPASRGCLLEITNNGQDGSYLKDGDVVTIKGWAGAGGQPKIGFGLCRGPVVG
jgi:fumarylacetoacetase